MRNIKVEEYKESYLNEINSLISKDRSYIPKISSTKYTLLLFEEQNIIGIGSIWDNFIHPYRDYISIYIDPNKRYKGLGQLLFQELQKRCKLKKLQTAFDSDNTNAICFAKKCGFRLARKTYCYDVSRENLKPLNYNCVGEIIKVSNLTKAQLEDVIIMQYKDYKTNHQGINPLNENMKIEHWKEIIFKDVEKNDSYVLLKNSDIVAYFLCYEGDETSIEVGYTGNRCSNIKEYKAFLYEVIIQLFNSYNKIYLEIDNCNKSTNILGELFSYNPSLSWDTYIKP